MNKKLVSVFCVTYNHKPYIGDALEGFVMQKTNFDYEVFVYDDASTDGTRDILLEYQKKYPDIFRLYLSEKNRWKDKERKKFILDLRKNNLTSKYIACCEGDDYWIDENKLQVQVDYMENHPECFMYLHNCQWLDCTTGEFKCGNPFLIDGEGDVSVHDLVMQKNGHPPTASFLFRRDLFDAPFFFYSTSVGDYPLVLCALAYGKVHYNSKKMSIYRFKSSGSCTSKFYKDLEYTNYYHLGLIQFLIQYNNYTSGKWEMILYLRLFGFVAEFLRLCKRNNINSRECFYGFERKGYHLTIEDDNLLNKLDEFMDYEDVTYLSNNTRKFISNYSKIVVMGTGRYSQILTEQLNYHGISFEGYAVSDLKNNCKEFNGKKVWELGNLPFDKNDLGVVVGILIKDKIDIINALKRANIVNYCMPFEYDLFRERR